jgi:hypothetical protein
MLVVFVIAVCLTFQCCVVRSVYEELESNDNSSDGRFLNSLIGNICYRV